MDSIMNKVCDLLNEIDDFWDMVEVEELEVPEEVRAQISGAEEYLDEFYSFLLRASNI